LLFSGGWLLISLFNNIFPVSGVITVTATNIFLSDNRFSDRYKLANVLFRIKPMTATKTRKPATLKDLITTEAAKSFDVWEEPIQLEEIVLPANEEPNLSHTPAFLFLMAAVAVLVVGKAFIACAVLAFKLGRKMVNAAIDARTPKINFAAYSPIFEGLEA
jgi:hypothetical protein